MAKLDNNGDVNGNVSADQPVDEPIRVVKRLTSMEVLVKRLVTGAVVVVVAITLSLLQPWESPKEKVADEWVACNMKYADQCSFAGTPFRTPSGEMALSEFIHGNITDKRLDKLRYPNGH